MLKLKLVGILALVLLAPISQAKDEASNIERVVTRDNFESYTFRSKRDAKNSCESKIAEILNDAESNLNGFFPKGYEYECSSIQIVTESDFDTVSYVGSMSRGWGAIDHKYTIALTIKCIPRKLSEKALYAMAQRCEENPTAACFDEQLLTRLDQIGMTKFTYEHKGSSCKPVN